MKQIDFEDAMRQMKDDHRKQVDAIIEQVNDLDVIINNMGQTAHEILVERGKMVQKRKALNTYKDELCRRNADKVMKFRKENWTSERKLSEVSDCCLVNELAARGFHGTIEHEDRPEDFMQVISKVFAGGGGISSDAEEQHDTEQVA